VSFEKKERVLEHRYSMNQKRGGDLRAVKFEVFTGKNLSSKAYEKRGREENGHKISF
jgi:hypothetical protein